MDTRFARWLLTICHFVIVVVADTAVPKQSKENTRVIVQASSLIQQRVVTPRRGKSDPATCTEAVIIEPRAVQYSAVALKSALGVAGVDLITYAHGEKNAEFAKQLVKGSTNLEEAYNQGSLRLLPLPVGDLKGDDVVNKMPQTMLISVNSSYCNGWHHEYTRLMVRPNFWNLLHCDRVLVFQSDTVFCHGSSVKIHEFTAFPYIGGETPHMSGGHGRIHMNGGFSLRSRAAMLQCIKHDMQLELQDRHVGEDEIYSRCPSLTQPPLDLVDRFAIDNALKLPRSAPLGVHKPWGGPFTAQVTQLCDGAQALTDAFKAEPGC